MFIVNECVFVFVFFPCTCHFEYLRHSCFKVLVTSFLDTHFIFFGAIYVTSVDIVGKVSKHVFRFGDSGVWARSKRGGLFCFSLLSLPLHPCNSWCLPPPGPELPTEPWSWTWSCYCCSAFTEGTSCHPLASGRGPGSPLPSRVGPWCVPSSSVLPARRSRPHVVLCVDILPVTHRDDYLVCESSIYLPLPRAWSRGAVSGRDFMETSSRQILLCA